MTNNNENPIVKRREFINGFAVFERKDGTQGWIGIDDKILAEGFDDCGDFVSPSSASFERKDGIGGWIKNTGEILVDGLKISSTVFKIKGYKG